ncbi:GNAT family N-acetyltransferase [Lysinibacillus piscis]|uniref:N-acetyltransferase YoaA n=1 Tax=Lysinibacillus piscis TaxID=2518931 RepID=A0ABQ5NKH0_9BACI|nr:GNAT family protein [Lysinibacillus sp. KH24]GLC88857.1 putative N-acetyltransferase YoaA [Lysinibacillus sp. KH24]
MFPLLETARLRLRALTTQDTERIFQCFAHEEVIRYYGQERFQELQQAERLIELFAQSFATEKGIRWGIELKETAEIIGTIGFHNWLKAHKRAEIGYELHPDYWHKGYAQEALTEVLAYGFQKMDLTRIGAVVFIENAASSQLLLKMGFQKEGILRAYMYQHGQAHDTIIYALLKTAYEGAN